VIPVAVVGVSHKTAPVSVRERFSFTNAEALVLLESLRDYSGMTEGVILSTCHRTELYVCPGIDLDLMDSAVSALKRKVGDLVGGTDQYLYHYSGALAAEHLYKVTAGLESLVFGEAEIQGQVKEAYDSIRNASTVRPLVGPILNRLFQSALAVGGKVRSETPVGQGAASVASVAVGLAKKIFGGLEDRTVMILGAGNTAELVVESMERNGISGLIVSNRCLGHAQKLAKRFSGRAVHFTEMPFNLNKVDILVASTAAPYTLVTLEGFRDALGGYREKPLLILDLAIPRDIEADVGGEPNVFLYNVDDLKEIVDDNLLNRKASIPIAQDIIAESVSSFLDWNQTLEVVPVIKDLRDSWDQERLNQLKWLWQKLPNLPENEKEIINIFSKRLINKLLHEPMSRLKKGVGNGKREDFVEAVRYLHDIQNVGPEDTGDLKKIPNLPTLIDGIADVK
jgi:glutamyl-tRNA reductase|tara:strand:- start:3631 stop:4989 length:1359 start_codon:yes stop_codon:yes gene_type:complete